ncbi:MAG: class I SAM-dependent methyltransferase [Candidatus Aureabacteria bacterium]|nr:class I SAM-dependent methyltransferase [Candidatus Auribacterota bacterium]
MPNSKTALKTDENPSRSVEVFTEYAIKNNLNISGNMLEPLCGCGLNGIVFARMNVNFFGLDPVMARLKEFQAKASFENLLGNVHLYNQDAVRTFPFEDNFFDFVLDISTSSTLIKDADLISYSSEITRVLKPGGRLMISYFSRDDGGLKKPKKSPSPNIFNSKMTNEPLRVFSPPDFREIYNLKLIPRFQTKVEYEETVGRKRLNRKLFVMILEKF